jgi:hypothetical protein
MMLIATVSVLLITPSKNLLYHKLDLVSLGLKYQCIQGHVYLDDKLWKDTWFTLK